MNGLLIQWGYVTSNWTEKEIISYTSSTTYQLFLTPIESSNTTFYISAFRVSASKISLKTHSPSGSAGGISWITIGY